MEAKLIELRREPSGWVARSETFRALFLTDTLPTAFTADASPDYVRRKVAALNPNCQVVIAQ